MVVLLFYKELVLVTFDPVFAVSLRLRRTLLTYLQYLLIALAIVVALQTIGIALVVTLMVAPAAAALQITRRFHHTVLVAAAIGMVSGVTGLYLSYYFNVASARGRCLVCVALFLVVTASDRLVARISGRARADDDPDQNPKDSRSRRQRADATSPYAKAQGTTL